MHRNRMQLPTITKLLLFSSVMWRISAFSPKKVVYSFNSPSTLEKISDEFHTKNVDHIFYLLSHTGPPQDPVYSVKTHNSNLKLSPVVNSKNMSNSLFDLSLDENHNSVKKSEFLHKDQQRYNQLVEMFNQTNWIKDVINIYHNQIKSNSRVPPSDDYDPMSVVVDFAERILTPLLNSTNDKELNLLASSTTIEDEILRELAAVIVGIEARSGYGYGYGMTFDPVTVIALLILAAYLLRAALQLVGTSGSGKRAINDFDNLWELPLRTYNAVEKWRAINIRKPKNFNPNESTFYSNVLSKMLTVAGDVELTKTCFRKFLCQQVAGKSLLDFELKDAFWTAIGIFTGSQDIVQHLQRYQHENEELCNKFSTYCYSQNENNGEARCISCAERHFGVY